MSILDRLRLGSHLDDAALAAIWTAAAADGRRPVHPHLASCAACRARFAQFTAWLEELRADAVAEADELFPAERLAAQQAQIFRRLEAAERPARVIAFPKFQPQMVARSSHASRWVAAAAAAGLIVGVGVGQMMDFRHAAGSGLAGVETRRQVTGAPMARTAAAARDEAFLSDLDASIARPPVPELRAIDDLTPRAGDEPR